MIGKSHLKFEPGTKVRVKNSKLIGVIKESYFNDNGYRVYFEDGDGGWDEEYFWEDLELYTKSIENIEEKLNLYDLLKRHEGEIFYSPVYGNVVIDFRDGQLRMWPISRDACLTIAPNGHHINNSERGCCLLFPSIAFYEKYPLDPYIAWMKWKEEQKCDLYISWYSQTSSNVYNYNQHIDFCTLIDRDRCIEEIKVIIEKYSK